MQGAPTPGTALPAGRGAHTGWAGPSLTTQKVHLHVPQGCPLGSVVLEPPDPTALPMMPAGQAGEGSERACSDHEWAPRQVTDPAQHPHSGPVPHPTAPWSLPGDPRGLWLHTGCCGNPGATEDFNVSGKLEVTAQGRHHRATSLQLAPLRRGLHPGHARASSSTQNRREMSPHGPQGHLPPRHP